MKKFALFPNTCNIPSSTIKSLFSFFSSLPKPQNSNPVFINYLIESFNFPKPRALALSNKLSHVKSLEKPQNVCQFLRNVGFSDTHIQSAVRVYPQLLLCDVNKTLKPKIEFLQNLGVVGSDLGKLLSQNLFFLMVSLEKTLIPCIEIFKQVLVDDKNNENLIRTLRRCHRLAASSKLVLLSNIELFKSIGIARSQLSMLLTARPRLFLMPEFKLKELVSQASEMGFSVQSRMFVHVLHSFSCVNEETFERKFELFKSYGFSKDEFIAMLGKVPVLVRMSEKRLKTVLDFFFKKAKLEKAALFDQPVYLTYSIENRMIPRYRVFKIVTSRRLLKKKCTFLPVLVLTEEQFLQKFVLRFVDNAEELFLAYKGQKLGSSSSSSS